MTTDNVREIPKAEDSRSAEDTETKKDSVTDHKTILNGADSSADNYKSEDVDTIESSDTNKTSLEKVTDKKEMISDISVSEKDVSKIEQDVEKEIALCDSLIDNNISNIEAEKEKFTNITKEQNNSLENKSSTLDDTLPLEEKSENIDDDNEVILPATPNGTKQNRRKPATPRRTGRKRKLSCLSPGILDL